MVVRNGANTENPNGELALLEATGNTGVQVCPWAEFVQNDWHLLYR